MVVADFVNHLDDETWVGIGLPADEGGGMVVFRVADYVGMDDMTLRRLGPYIDRETYDAYLDIFDSPETGERVPRIVVPVAPKGNTEGENDGEEEDNGD